MSQECWITNNKLSCGYNQEGGRVGTEGWVGVDFICRTCQRKFWKMHSGWTEKNVYFESDDATGVNRIESYNL